MSETIGRNEFQVGFQPTVTPPVYELMTQPEAANDLWGQASGLIEQVAIHGERVKVVDACLDALPSPTTTLQQAVESGEVSSVLTGQCYEVLADVLDEPDYRRLALYLPFELLPKADWEPNDEGLQKTADRFRRAYMFAWSELLKSHDVAANFTNGDVIEPEYRDGDLPRVVKAAHLLPELVELGLISEQQVDQLLYITSDPLLRASIEDAVAGQRDKLNDPYDVPMVAMTQARQAWIAREEARLEREQTVSRITEEINEKGLQPSLVEEAKSLDAPEQLSAVVEGIYRAIELAAQRSQAQASLIYDQSAELLQSCWNVEVVRPELERIYRKMYHLGLVSKTEMDQYGVELPNLSGRFSENVDYIRSDIQRIQALTTQFADDPELSRLIYPIAIVGGSRIKGYGERSSDIDIAIFVRPGVDSAEQSLIRQRVADLTGGAYESSEFWLETDEDNLRVKDLPTGDSHTASSDWAHSLFCNAWVGSSESIRELQTRLLPLYFDASNPDARRGYIERIEQDTLQYRLLHSGYDRHSPRYSVHSNSTFWDAGYRQLATRLFIDKVFLPRSS
jgi:hypothetical protein